MMIINLKTFTLPELQEFYDIITSKHTRNFRIVLPKKQHDKFETSTRSYFIEYAMAAYTGQLLFELAGDLSYNVPSNNSSDPFYFEIETTESKTLCEILWVLLQVYNETANPVFFEFFEKLATVFFSDCFQNKIDPAVWGLLDVADKLYLE